MVEAIEGGDTSSGLQLHNGKLLHTIKVGLVLFFPAMQIFTH